jgi:hypothetical protein
MPESEPLTRPQGAHPVRSPARSPAESGNYVVRFFLRVTSFPASLKDTSSK